MSLSYWVLPHTHWDREWYLTFQQFRWKLVATVDAVLDTLQADRRFEHFMLDGQAVALEDYLELRPERRQVLSELVQAGRVAVGPWYVQPDDILVTGEALIRNLERGIRIARAFGAAMPVGYLPDSFGHCAALPAVLRGFGLEAAALMRGVGPTLDKVFFGWTARDGSRVLVAYLVDTYGNGADLPMEPAAFRSGLAELEERQRDARVAGVPLLVMNGMDHRSIVAALPRAIEESGLGDRAVIGSLPGYIALAQPLLAGIPEWAGELRSTWRCTITAGCTSSRQWIKREDQATSALLEREAEPLAALAWWMGAPYPSAALELAWKHLLLNQAHDSICGCSIDEVHEDMRYRYAQARGLGRNIAAQAAEWIASRVDTGALFGAGGGTAGGGSTAVIAVNAGPARRDALLSFAAARLPPDPVLVDREGRRHAVQLVAEEGGSAVFFDERFSPRQLRFAMGMVRDGTIMEFAIHDARSSWETPAVLRIDLELGPRGHSAFDWNGFARGAVALLETPGLAQVHAVGLRSGARSALFTADLPAFAARSFRLEAGDGPARTGGSRSAGPRLRAGRRFLQNDRFHVRVMGDGSLEVRDSRLGLALRGVNGIVDEADRGDEYNYDRIPGDRPVTGPSVVLPRVCRARTEVVESGPVRATLCIRSTWRLPASIGRDRRTRSRRRALVEVVRYVSLTAAGDRIEFRTVIANAARDHRMRVRIPLPAAGSECLAGGTFGAVRRPARSVAAPEATVRPASPELTQEEEPVTHPFTGFVACAAARGQAEGGATVAVLARGLREYEIVERRGRSELAVTLFRSVGWLSRADLSSRRGNAGPDTATPGAQEFGTHAFEYALLFAAGVPAEDLLSREWESYRSAPPVVLRAAASGDLGDGQSLIELMDEQLVFSSLRRLESGTLALRAYDTGGTARVAMLRFPRPLAWARKTRIDGTAVCPLECERDGTATVVRVPVDPWEIVTVEAAAQPAQAAEATDPSVHR